ncbi:restriction endonuclease subunit S [Salinibacter ruber]|uniref:restriction endonuclease subunit S n=1 Tax=Salinibacter ruber TaxID=146919 RepID=UPI0021689FF6|nr:restriction endonuclease subunit S [Salinibacter ruber]MCS3650377.1 type I restriction enzyme S subunit [Salinibacter ruber]MCS3653629.1 type I restriction enzyme S subunit [Salinibacter ruber]MCS4039730.1 type I restriction enzyme S subunit [Salinibacter ruber]MCS4085835.1 type I restriction enzyme S subunit [Salinibacter ruber]
MSETLEDLFNFPDYWPSTRLGEIAEVISPGFPCGDHNQEGRGTPHLRPMNISEKGEIDLSKVKYVEEDYTPLRAGDVLFNNTNSPVLVGKTAHIDQDQDWAHSNHMTRIRGLADGVSSKWIANWLHFLFQDGYFRMHCRNHVNQASIGVNFLKDKVDVPLPPLPEQRRIVGKIEELFSNLDVGMADLQVAGQQLERYRLSVLQAAVEGRLTADWRRTHDPEPADQLLERILEKRRERWEEDYRTKRYDSKGKTPPDGWKDRYSEPDPVDSSDLPSLPSSWKWVRFEQISLLDSGYAFSSDKFTDEGMPLLRGANVAPGHLKWGDTEYWPEDEVGSYEHLIVEEGDIILAMDRPLINAGLKIARAEESDTPCLLVQRVARFKPVFESLTAFLYLTCSTQRFIAHLREGQTGTQIPHVSKKSLRAYPVPLPPLDEQKQIVDEVERLLSVADDAAATADRENTRAERLRQSILKQAFSGRLVPHDEDAAPPAIETSSSNGTGQDASGDKGSSASEDSSGEDDVVAEEPYNGGDPGKQIEMDL